MMIISAMPVPITVSQAEDEPVLSYRAPTASWMPELLRPQATFITERILPLWEAGIRLVRNGEDEIVLKISPNVKTVMETKQSHGWRMNNTKIR